MKTFDVCVICEGACEWQPSLFQPERERLRKKVVSSFRLVKICSRCLPTEDFQKVRALVRFYYPKVRF